MYKVLIIIIGMILLFAGLFGFSSCGSEDQVEVPACVHTLAEDLLQAFNTGDYIAYLEHFEENVDWVMPEDYFTQQVTYIQKKIGYYIPMSKEFSEAKVTEKDTDVYYKARFSSEPDDVVVTVTYYISDNRVYAEGIWFNSPKLRGQ